MEQPQVFDLNDVHVIEQNRKRAKLFNDAKRKAIIKEIENWDTSKDNYKFQFFFSLIVNAYYTKDLLEAVNKDYPEIDDLL